MMIVYFSGAAIEALPKSSLDQSRPADVPLQNIRNLFKLLHDYASVFYTPRLTLQKTHLEIVPEAWESSHFNQR